MKKRILVIVFLVMVAAICFISLKKRKADLAKAPPAPVLPAVVATIDLKSHPIMLTLPAIGLVASDVSTVLSTRISGQVTEVLKQEGDPVKKGETLARIDAADLAAKKQGLALQRQGIVFQIEAKRAEVQSLETALKSALEAHARTKQLLDIKGASPEQYSQEHAEIAKLKAGLTAARASIETLQKSMETLAASMREVDSQIRYAVLVAPIDGTVSQVLARPGDLATPGRPLMKIASRKGLYLNLSLPTSVHASEIMLRDSTLPLSCKDQTGDTGLVQYAAPLPQKAEMVEGQYVTVQVVIYKGAGVLLPVDALLTMDGSSSVFLLSSSGKAERLQVTIKARGIEGVTVEQDLSGRKVIVAKPDILLRVAAGVPVIASKS